MRLTRRRLLGIGAGAVGLGAAKAIDNVVLGYGTIGGGTNLHEQELSPLLDERRSLRGEFGAADRRYAVGEEAIHERRAGASGWRRYPLDEPAPDTDRGVRELHGDVNAIDGGEYEYEPMGLEAFFDRLAGGASRPYTTAALRGSVSEPVTPTVVRRFADADPSDPDALVYGLKAGFREHAAYDIPRYVGGSIEDNVIRGAVDLRAPFEGPTDFETLLERERTGVFCWELTNRAVEALHANAATDQRPPVACFWVRDRRHKHVYNGLAGVIREDGGLRLPVAFVDYTHSTLYDDLRVRRLVGEGLDAYDRRHRADEIGWSV
jgi:hypothetical protein